MITIKLYLIVAIAACCGALAVYIVETHTAAQREAETTAAAKRYFNAPLVKEKGTKGWSVK